MTAAPIIDDPLAPVRDALLLAAEADAAGDLADADAYAAQARTRARDEADRIAREALDGGESDAARVVAAERARVRRQARSIVLRAQREAWEELRRRVATATAALSDDPAYPEIRARLAATVQRELGSQGDDVVELADGFAVTAGGRRASLTLTQLAERAASDALPDLERLWSS
jgi:vacuolar-type H+-ATPase subunit E/Vma4